MLSPRSFIDFRWFIVARSVCLFVICGGLLTDAVTTVNVAKGTGETGPGHNKVVVCYISSWATYRPDRGSFTLDDIDPSLCTHLIHAFAGLNITSNTIRSLDPYNDLEEDWGKGSYKKLAAMKQKHPHLKITLAIGGWNEGSANYSLLASSPERRAVFVQSAVDFIRKYNFDGLDLDWEFPGKRGGQPEDKENFVSLVKELRTAFDKHNWLLTAALGAGVDTINVAYDVKALSQHLDFLHAMCYDYHGAFDKRTGVNTPLLSQSDKFSVVDSIEHFLKMGAPPKKLVLGLALYGRTFIMDGEENKDIRVLGIPASGNGFQGPYTREDGFLGYNEICLEVGGENSTWQQYWDTKTETPYAVQGNRVISYDNHKSITEKVKYAIQNDLGGLMVWAMDNDDFRGDCDAKHKTTYPLLRTISNAVIEAVQEKHEREQKKKDEEKGKSSAVVATVARSGVLAVVIIALLRLLNHT